jgi:hypothetical protein
MTALSPILDFRSEVALQEACGIVTRAISSIVRAQYAKSHCWNAVIA